MTPALGIALLWLWDAFTRRRGAPVFATTSQPSQLPYQAPRPRPPAMTASTAAPAMQAAQAATAALTKPQPGKPPNIHQAFQASHAAAQQLATQAQQLQAAVKAAPPWPAAKPPDLPPWPSGWEPDKPPPPAVVTRAWQLLPILWKKGKGTKAVETTKGRWITYVAEDHGGGKKGVTAYRVKAAK